jgi:hypothetical protein
MSRIDFSRRGFLKGLAGIAGAALGTRFAGSAWETEAAAAGETASLVVLHLVGGYNALFGSADSLVGKFGVTAGNHTVLGGVGLDNVFASSMGQFAKDHVATVGVRHGISSHPAARASLWTHNAQNAGILLANAIGGNASIKMAHVGGNMVAEAPKAAVAGTSIQTILDMQSTINALGGGTPNPRVPDRTMALAGMEGGEEMSMNAMNASPASLDSLKNGYSAAIATLKQPAKTLDLPGLRTAYGIGNATAVTSFASKMAAAELMILAGANVVTLSDTGWDTHGDTQGVTVRNKMTALMPAMNTFLNRMVAEPTRNVTFAIVGDFARSLPGSDHQPNLSVTVIGRNVKRGTTGRTQTGTVSLAQSTPGVQGMWAYLATLAKVGTNPFGANPHPSITA